MIPLGGAIAIFAAPLLLWVFYYSWRVRRETARAEMEARPFTPPPDPAPSNWLRRLPAAERAYLQYLMRSARGGYLFSSWLIFSIVGLPLANIGSAHHTTWNNASAFLWFRYLLGATGMIGTTCGMLGLGFAIAAVYPMRRSPTAQFFRTRPIGMSFYFWSRVLYAAGILLSAIVTAAAASFALLYLLHGSIWRHLPATFPGTITGQGDDRSEWYLSLLATSALRVFLSLCTTATLAFSGFVAMFTLPAERLSGRGSSDNTASLFFIPGMIGVLAFSALVTLNIVPIPRQLFVYAHLGPPPPYEFALYPLLLSAGLLLLARFFVTRLEG
jgi:hypothetical protein